MTLDSRELRNNTQREPSSELHQTHRGQQTHNEILAKKPERMKGIQNPQSLKWREMGVSAQQQSPPKRTIGINNAST